VRDFLHRHNFRVTKHKDSIVLPYKAPKYWEFRRIIQLP